MLFGVISVRSALLLRTYMMILSVTNRASGLNARRTQELTIHEVQVDGRLAVDEAGLVARYYLPHIVERHDDEATGTLSTCATV